MAQDRNHYSIKQGADTGIGFCEHAREYLDAQFGKGYAAKHPELMVAIVQAAALDTLGHAINAAALTLSEAIEEHADALRKD
jgi:hypothetical protein